jgi:hypothetical protein
MERKDVLASKNLETSGNHDQRIGANIMKQRTNIKG